MASREQAKRMAERVAGEACLRACRFFPKSRSEMRGEEGEIDALFLRVGIFANAFEEGVGNSHGALRAERRRGREGRRRSAARNASCLFPRPCVMPRETRGHAESSEARRAFVGVGRFCLAV
jgi:hypothetical protein